METNDYGREIERQYELAHRWQTLPEKLTVCGIELEQGGGKAPYWTGRIAEWGCLYLEFTAHGVTLRAVRPGRVQVSVDDPGPASEPRDTITLLAHELRRECVRRMDSMQRQIADLDEMTRTLRGING